MRIPALALKRKQWEPFAFASPAMVLIAFVIVFPLAYSFYLSFQNFDLRVICNASLKNACRRSLPRISRLGANWVTWSFGPP